MCAIRFGMRFYMNTMTIQTPMIARGNDPEEAALYLADRHFSDWDFPDQMEIWVKKPEDTEWVKFDISVQAVPEFTANQKVAA
jgi:hypothetical protein